MERRSGIEHSGIEYGWVMVERHDDCPSYINWYLTVTIDLGFWLWLEFLLISWFLPEWAILDVGQGIYSGCEAMRDLARKQGRNFMDMQCSHVATGRPGVVTMSYRKTVLKGCFAPSASQS